MCCISNALKYIYPKKFKQKKTKIENGMLVVIPKE